MRRLKLYHKTAYRTICLLISIAVALCLWFAISSIPSVSTVFVSPIKVWRAFVKNVPAHDSADCADSDCHRRVRYRHVGKDYHYLLRGVPDDGGHDLSGREERRPDPD